MTDSKANDIRVPVTILTGFLGAGKTTLLNAILNDASNGRAAVIVNEFGEEGLDHDLIEESGDEITLMQSGCLCCSVRGDLSKTIMLLLSRRAYKQLEFERIVIETTGLADPGPILQTLLVDRHLAKTTKMDGVVTVADAVNGPATLDAQFEAVSQAATADLIVVSKTDLVSPSEVTAFEDRLSRLNPAAQIVHSVKGQGISDKIYGLSALTPDAKTSDVLAWTSDAKATASAPLGATQPAKADPLANLSGFASTKSTPVASSMHDDRIGSASIVLDDPIPDVVFDRWLDTLISLRGPDVLRIKGIVFLESVDLPFVFHGVQHVFDPPVQLKEWSKEDRRSRIVVIARDLSQPEIQASLEMLKMREKA
ncbi:CobW family GTP-binding protein [Cognatishimia activa]|uniref:Putative GTP-binding protein YjiA n=1 Tax=Cognatishimia activa TaxID=1715691 RepID=A0A0P1ITK3_9RHOB|nr:GTP-binding protein [Cognatishimia activa]CUI81536.1 putative GTP-binding protein YjiA [Cognatishimia activa]CUK26909.1 putative GTP-binding protein YjiA [Cognatishimia activa]